MTVLTKLSKSTNRKYVYNILMLGLTMHIIFLCHLVRNSENIMENYALKSYVTANVSCSQYGACRNGDLGASVNQRTEKTSHLFDNFTTIKPMLHRKTYTGNESVVNLFDEWLDAGELHCENESDFEGFPQFVRIKNVIIDRRFGSSPSGGENVAQVLGQNESTEFLTLKPGFFQISCKDPSPMYFWGNHHMQNWFINLANTPSFLIEPVNLVIHHFTLAIVRIEYANLYHMVQDLYSAFLMMEFFEKPQFKTNVLLIEAHPWTPLDQVWYDFFNHTQRVSSLPDRTQFKELVWCIGSHDNPMSNFMDPNLPLVEEFRDFMLTTYRIDPQSHILDCSNIVILLLWRRDYVAHARNPSGVIQRKFYNEQEILRTLQQTFDNATIKAVQIEKLNMSTQLKLISETDVLIGMLGAGLTHAMFLPQTSGLVELRPQYYKEISQHFESIAKWRRLKYIRWVNKDPKNEVERYKTRIPPQTIVDNVNQMIKQICPPP